MNTSRVPSMLDRRRLAALALAVAVPLGLAVFGGHRGDHMVRSLLVPGAGLYGEAPLLGATLTALAVAAVGAWMVWGFDVGLVAVMIAAVVLSGVVPPAQHGGAISQEIAQPGPTSAAHEFPLVVLVVAWLGWVRMVARRLPPLRWWAERRRRATADDDLAARLEALSTVDRCRAATIRALGLGTDHEPAPDELAWRDAITSPAVTQRARRIGWWCRGRWGGDPLRVDHAAARTALAAWHVSTAAARRAACDDAARSGVGAPPSEPTWVRLIDLVLFARVTGDPDHLARRSLGSHFAGGHARIGRPGGRRPAWYWTPLGVSGGRSEPWEHATATALARDAGWIGDDDWAALRRPVLGAAARGTAIADDERLIAAGRLWLRHVDDAEARRIVGRPTVGHDPLAFALDQLATRMNREPAA